MAKGVKNRVDRAVIDLFRSGWTIAEIALFCPVNREKAEQIIREYMNGKV